MKPAEAMQRQRPPGYSIAMVAACPFPANYGSAASIREMSDTLCELGHNIHVVTYPTGQNDIQVRCANVHRTSTFRPEVNAEVGPSAEKVLFDIRLLRLLCRVIRQEKIDIIHAHNYEGALVGIIAKWITGRPLLYNAVNLMENELASYQFIRPAFLANGLARSLDWFTPIFPDHITTVSSELEKWLVEHGVPAEKIEMVPAGIEPQLFDNPTPEKFRQQYHINDRPVVMYTGVLNAFQRVDYLLRAFAVVLQAQPGAILLIVSPLVSQRYENEYKRLAGELGLTASIIWIAPHRLGDLKSYLALADVTVVPRAECPGHPVKLLNYMLAGKPVVTFAAAAKGVRHMHDAFIVPNHDFEAFGRGIITLLQNPALAAKLGANAKATVLANFDWRQVCRKIERIYDRLLGVSSASVSSVGEPDAPAAVEH